MADQLIAFVTAVEALIRSHSTLVAAVVDSAVALS